MKVLNVNYTLDPVIGGGTAERTFQLSRFLAKSGAECEVLTLEAPPEREEALLGAGLVTVPYVSKRLYLPKTSIRRIREVVRGADVVHLMGHWPLVNALVYRCARSLGKPHVVCPAGGLPVYGRSRQQKNLYNRLVGEAMVRKADGHVAITADEIPQFAAYGVDPGRVSVIPNGIDAREYAVGEDAGFRARHGLGDRPFVLFVGRLNRIKGPDLLLDAFCRASKDLPDHDLVLAGPDEGMLPELLGTAARAGVSDRVHFIGYLGGAEKSRAYHAAELLAVPSRQEAMSLVALEAGITGTPVLITDRCGFDEVARAGGGKVVAASAEALREGLVALLKDRARLEAMGGNLRRLVEKEYTWEVAVERYLGLYERLLGRQVA